MRVEIVVFLGLSARGNYITAQFTQKYACLT